MLMEAAPQVDPDFKIMLMPDMNAEFKGEKEPVKLTKAIQTLGNYPSALRLDDGKLVICPFLTEARTPEWWKSWIDSMKDAGTPVAFMPMVLGQANWKEGYGSIAFGASEWGPRSPAAVAGMRDTPAQYHKKGLIWMAPVAPQDMRPKDFIYWETKNTVAFRMMWENAIKGEADWVQLITWSDYSEATEILPSSGTQYLFYDLTTYYATWFKTGEQPKIVRDVLYYSHRLHSTEAEPDLTKQKKKFTRRENEPDSNQVELLAFLKEPGTLQIELAGKTYTQEAPAGITSFMVPLANGRPRFKLIRGGNPTINFEGNWEISDKITYQNFLYCGGSSSRPPVN